MPQVLTDADIDKASSPSVLTDSDIDAHGSSGLHDQANAAIKGFASGVASKLNPMEKLKGIADLLQAVHDDPAGVIENFSKQVLLHPYTAFARGVEAAKAGNLPEAVAHFGSILEPPGTGLEEATVKGITPGQRAEGLGEITGIGADALIAAKAPEVLSKAVQKAKGLATRPSVLRGAGTVIGAKVGGPIGAILGREMAGDLAESLNSVPAEEARPPVLPPEPAQPPALPSPTLDDAAKAIGAKDFASATAAQQKMAQAAWEQVHMPKTPAPTSIPVTPASAVAQTALAQPAPQPAPQVGGGGPLRPPLAQPEVTPATPSAPATADTLTEKLNALLRQAKIDAGMNPDLPLGELPRGTYLKRFTGDDSPIIDSGLRKAGSTAEVANPSKLLSKTKFLKTLPENSPLLGNPKALDAAYKLALELKKTGSSLGIGDLMTQTGK